MSLNDKSYFLPSMRRGLATGTIELDETGRSAIDVTIKLNGPGLETTGEIPKKVFLYGPGDLIGFDPTIILRTDPVSGVNNFEQNLFPAVEFSEPDFPWRFTPLNADSNGNLIPWITLIVLLAEDIPDPGQPEGYKYKEFIPQQAGGDLPGQWIIVETANLPDLNQAWRWVHVQATNENLSNAIARLICPRCLRPEAKYTAFVVPTFELGRKAAVPNKLQRSINAEDITALTLAWDINVNEEIELPYYFKWEFRTGTQGDFEYLVRLLEPRHLPHLGIRDLNCSQPGYGLQVAREDLNCEDENSHILGLEGALKAPGIQFTPWGKDLGYDQDGNLIQHEPPQFQRDLAALLNKPRMDLENPVQETPPVVVPPIYGCWHAAKDEVSPEGDKWIDELNLDPRHRTAAGLGAAVVRQEQERLMASAWKQLGDVLEANEIIRRSRFGLESTLPLEERLNLLPMGDFLRTTSTVHPQVLYGNQTIFQNFYDSKIPTAIFDPSFRRVSKLFGAIRKKQQPNHSQKDVIVRLNEGTVIPAGTHPIPKGTFSIDDISETLPEITVNNPPVFISRPYNYGDSRIFLYDIRIDDPDVEQQFQIELVEVWHNISSLQVEFKNISNKASQLKITFPQLDYEWENQVGVELSVKDNGIPQKKAGQIFSIYAVNRFVTNPWENTDDPGSGYGDGQGYYGTRSYNAVFNWEVYGFIQWNDPPVPLPTGVFNAASITPDNVQPENSNSQDPEIVNAVTHALNGFLALIPEPPDEPKTVNLGYTAIKLKRFLNPRNSFVRMTESLLNSLAIPNREEGSFEILFTNPEFYQPMYEPLRDISPELLLPGIGTVPRNTVAILETNRRFIEAYLCGLNHEFSGELLWREYPTDQRGTYFRQFWSGGGWDIKSITAWNRGLGSNRDQTLNEEKLVLLIKGDLIAKYRNPVMYAVVGVPASNGTMPALAEFGQVPGRTIYPVFRGDLSKDTLLLGFEISVDDAWGNEQYPCGWYFVIEERISELHFGLNTKGESPAMELGNWDQLSWSHIPGNMDIGIVPQSISYDAYIDANTPPVPANSEDLVWNNSSGDIAGITMQKPVRVLIHTRQILSVPPNANPLVKVSLRKIVLVAGNNPGSNSGRIFAEFIVEDGFKTETHQIQSTGTFEMDDNTAQDINIVIFNTECIGNALNIIIKIRESDADELIGEETLIFDLNHNWGKGGEYVVEFQYSDSSGHIDFHLQIE